VSPPGTSATNWSIVPAPDDVEQLVERVLAGELKYFVHPKSHTT
jgi:hypothetical protein